MRVSLLVCVCACAPSLDLSRPLSTSLDLCPLSNCFLLNIAGGGASSRLVSPRRRGTCRAAACGQSAADLDAQGHTLVRREQIRREESEGCVYDTCNKEERKCSTRTHTYTHTYTHTHTHVHTRTQRYMHIDKSKHKTDQEGQQPATGTECAASLRSSDACATEGRQQHGKERRGQTW